MGWTMAQGWIGSGLDGKGNEGGRKDVESTFSA